MPMTLHHSRLRQLSVLLATVTLLSASETPIPQTEKEVFEDITVRLGIHFKHQASPTNEKYLVESMGPGVAVFDYDNDGRLDIFVTNGAKLLAPMPLGASPDKSAPQYWDRLFHQKSDGSFEDVTVKAGLSGKEYGMGVAVGDYDNDGFDDLYVTGFPRNHLYHNDGNGAFTDVTDSAGVGASGWSTSAMFVDIDNDGRLDLFVDRYLEWSFEKNTFCGEHRPGYRAYCHPDVFPSKPNLLFHNEGKGKFTDVSRKAGISIPEGKSLGVALNDYDRDGRMDILVANDSVREFLFHNLGGGKFDEVGVQAGTAVDENGHVFAGMGVDFSDYDNDCWPDIVISDLANQMYAVYQNHQDGTFVYATDSTGLGRMTLLNSGWGLRLFDYDNDGWKDLLVAQGHVLDTIELTQPHLQYRQTLLLARNTGKGFEDVSSKSGSVFQERWAARGLAIGDLDNDGRLDVVVATNNGALYVLRNVTAKENHWLKIKLTGTLSNRDAIGASVKIRVGSSIQCSTLTTSSSYLSASDKTIHFGLGDANTVEEIEVRWPSGIVQKMHKVLADRTVSITEPPETSKDAIK